jgi:hypothetical protein
VSGAQQNGLAQLIRTACERANLPLLPAYLPGILTTFAAYQLIYSAAGPWLSATLFPKMYPQLRGRKKVEWDENVPSFIHAVVLCTLSAQVVLFDEEKQSMGWQARVWDYTEPTAAVLTVALGYFYFHLFLMVWHRKTFGWAMVAHAVTVSFLMTNGYVSIDLESISALGRTAPLMSRAASSFHDLRPIFVLVRNIDHFPGHPIDAEVARHGRHRHPARQRRRPLLLLFRSENRLLHVASRLAVL